MHECDEVENNMRRYDIVLFDLYGTLIDIRTDEESDHAWAALREALARCGAEYDSTVLLREEFDRLLQAEIIRAGQAQQMVEPEHVEPDLLAVYEGLLASKSVRGDIPSLAGHVAWEFRQASTSLLKLYDGADSMLASLRTAGLRTVLVSNAQHCYTMPELEMLGLTSELDHIVISSDEGVRKPSAELFLKALREENMSAERAVMVGNDERCDIEGAKAAGIDGIYLHTEISPASDADTAQHAVLSVNGADYGVILDYILKEQA